MGDIPTLPTFAAGERLTAAKLNALAAAQAFWTLPPRAAAYQNVPQSIPTATYTMVSLGAEIFDVVQAGDTEMHSVSTNKSRITIRTAGKYSVTGQISYAASATGSRKCLIVKNGVTVLAEAGMVALPGGMTSVIGAGPVIAPLNPGDYLELQAYHDRGSALNTDTTFVGSTWLQVLLDSA